MILEVEKPLINENKIDRNEPNKDNTRSSTKKVNYLTTLKIAPSMFKMDAVRKMTTQKGTEYLDHIDPRKDTITIKPLAKHINCKQQEQS